MNGSKQHLRLALFGAAAVLALATGCSRKETARPAQQARQQTPTFESAVPGAQGGTQMQGPGYGAPQEPVNEHAMCASLVQHADLRVEDIAGGVVLIATPKAGSDLATVRRDALQIDRVLPSATEPQAAARPKDAGERCSLFDLGQMSRTGMVEQGNEIRILLISQDPARVNELRSQARNFAQQWGSMGQQQR